MTAPLSSKCQAVRDVLAVMRNALFSLLAADTVIAGNVYHVTNFVYCS